MYNHSTTHLQKLHQYGKSFFLCFLLIGWIFILFILGQKLWYFYFCKFFFKMTRLIIFWIFLKLYIL